MEAYPDISDVSAQVITQVNGLAAEEVEQQITIPLEQGLMGTPGVSVMRSKSTFGLSLITLVFKDGVEDYWCRQRIQERISGIALPYGATPGLDPLTSAWARSTATPWNPRPGPCGNSPNCSAGPSSHA